MKTKRHIRDLDFKEWACNDGKYYFIQQASTKEYTLRLLEDFEVEDWQRQVMLSHVMALPIVAITEEDFPSREEVIKKKKKPHPNFELVETPSWYWKCAYFKVAGT